MLERISLYQQKDFMIRVENDNFYIEVIGIHLQTGESSNICTLNYILSSLDIQENEFEKTCWIVTDTLVEKCHNLFKDNNYNLQDALLEDYIDGGWLN